MVHKLRKPLKPPKVSPDVGSRFPGSPPLPSNLNQYIASGGLEPPSYAFGGSVTGFGFHGHHNYPPYRKPPTHTDIPRIRPTYSRVYAKGGNVDSD